MMWRVRRQTKRLQKHGRNYEPRAVTDDTKGKSSEVEIILEKWLQKQTMTTMSGSINQFIELGITTLATTSLHNDEYTPSNYQDAAWSSK